MIPVSFTTWFQVLDLNRYYKISIGIETCQTFTYNFTSRCASERRVNIWNITSVKYHAQKHVFLCNILNISCRDLSTHISTFSDVEESWEMSSGPSTAAKPSIAPRSRLRNFFLAMIIPFPYSKAMKLPRCMHSRKCIKGDRKSVRINVFVDGPSAKLKKELPLPHA